MRETVNTDDILKKLRSGETLDEAEIVLVDLILHAKNEAPEPRLEFQDEDLALVRRALIEGRKNYRDVADDYEKQATVCRIRPAPEGESKDEDIQRADHYIEEAARCRTKADEMSELLERVVAILPPIVETAVAK